MKVLVTGGAGYIGSVTATALEAAGHTPVILDSLLSGPEAFVAGRIFYRGDIADRELLTRIVADHPDLDCTIHMAARVVVGESVALPYLYYRDNVAKSLELFDQLTVLGKPRVVFSSSASVYAAVEGFEVFEDSPTAADLPVRADQADDGAWCWRISPPAPTCGRWCCATSTRSAPIPSCGTGSTCGSPATCWASW